MNVFKRGLEGTGAAEELVNIGKTENKGGTRS
jgi:hypothetical protein